MEDKRVSIVILNYNCWQDTTECLESVFKSNYKNYQVIVVDNDSTDDSMNYLMKWADGTQEVIYRKDSNLQKLTQPPVLKPLKYFYYTQEEILKNDETKKDIFLNYPLIFIQSGRNGGFAAGNNIAIKYILSTQNEGYIWLLNPDTVIESKCIDGFLNKMKNNGETIFGSVIRYYQYPEKILFYGGFKVHKMFHGIKRMVDRQDINQIDSISGTSLFISTASIRQLGLLPEEYFMYWEEAHFCTKAKKAGYKFDVLEGKDCCVYDKVGSNANTQYLKQYLYILNGLKYYKTFFPIRLPIIYISCMLKYILAFSKGHKITTKAIGNALRDHIFGAKQNVEKNH